MLRRVLAWILFGPPLPGYSSGAECPPRPDLLRSPIDGFRPRVFVLGGGLHLTTTTRRRK